VQRRSRRGEAAEIATAAQIRPGVYLGYTQVRPIRCQGVYTGCRWS
jgi:hypothetical protein